jgi:hypothetical protein
MTITTPYQPPTNHHTHKKIFFVKSTFPHAGQREKKSFFHAGITFFHAGITFFYAGITFFHARITFFHAGEKAGFG